MRLALLGLFAILACGPSPGGDDDGGTTSIDDDDAGPTSADDESGTPSTTGAPLLVITD